MLRRYCPPGSPGRCAGFLALSDSDAEAPRTRGRAVLSPLQAKLYFQSPRNAPTALWRPSGVTTAGSIGSPTAIPTLGNSFIAWRSLSRLRAKMLCHNPQSANGTTGTGVRSRILRMPPLN